MATGCSTKSHVELQSAQPPAVQPADGAEGQTDAQVIEAGAIELDDESAEQLTTTTTAPGGPTSTTTAPIADPAGDDGEASSDQLCTSDRRTLMVAVDAYSDEYGTAPTSEAELIATAFLMRRSDLYDVQIDGSVVAQGDTCAK